MAKVSICIPNFNKAKYLPLAIKSALDQSFEEIEVIVIDNCSTDNSWEIIESFSDVRLKKIRNAENVGMVGNFKLALAHTTTEYCTFLSSDDVLFSNAIQNLYSLLTKDNDAGFVFGNVAYSGNRNGRTHYNFKEKFNRGEFAKVSLSKTKNFVFLTGTLFRKEVEFQFPDLLFFDWFNWLDIAMTRKVLFLNQLVGTHHYYDENETIKQAGNLLVEYKQLDSVLAALTNRHAEFGLQIKTSRNELARKYWKQFLQRQHNNKARFKYVYASYVKGIGSVSMSMKEKILYWFDFNYIRLREKFR